jgi:acetyl-CoA carboxylase biotin carboxyl carrier protein
MVARDVRREIVRAVVRHHDLGSRKGLAERLKRRPDPIRLVPGGNDYYRFGRHRRLFCPAMAGNTVEAHITGTVWKVEVEVGDEIDEGDTVVILESMKMEMPVEAEDEGTVKEIRCEEGQSVQEGDVLVVLD